MGLCEVVRSQDRRLWVFDIPVVVPAGVGASEGLSGLLSTSELMDWDSILSDGKCLVVG